MYHIILYTKIYIYFIVVTLFLEKLVVNISHFDAKKCLL